MAIYGIHVPRHHFLQRGRDGWDPDTMLDPSLPPTADWGEYDVEDDLDELDLAASTAPGFGDEYDDYGDDDLEDEVGAFWHSKAKRRALKKRRQSVKAFRKAHGYKMRAGMFRPKERRRRAQQYMEWMRARRKSDDEYGDGDDEWLGAEIEAWLDDNDPELLPTKQQLRQTRRLGRRAARKARKINRDVARCITDHEDDMLATRDCVQQVLMSPLSLGDDYGDGDDEWLGAEIEAWLDENDEWLGEDELGGRWRRQYIARHAKPKRGGGRRRAWRKKLRTARKGRRRMHREFRKSHGYKNPLGVYSMISRRIFQPKEFKRRSREFQQWQKEKAAAVGALRNERQLALDRRFGDVPTDDDLLGFLPLVFALPVAAGVGIKGTISGRVRRAERKIARGKPVRPRLLRRLDMDKDRIIKRLAKGRGPRRATKLQDLLGRINAILAATQNPATTLGYHY